MIDPQTDGLIAVRKAPKHIPGNPSLATVQRWIGKGVRGRKLETLLVGGRRYTSIEAIRAFLTPHVIGDSPQETAADQLRRAREAGQALEALGA